MNLRFLQLVFFTVLLATSWCCRPAKEPPAVDPQVPVEPTLKVSKAPTASKAAGEDWPCFLGPNHDGTSRETGLLDKWPEQGPPLVWTQSVGSGYSAPSVQGALAVLHHRRGDEEIVEGFDAATGKSQWEWRYPSRFRDPYGYSNGPRCSPILKGNRCYTLGAEGKLLCLDLETIKPVWERDLHSQFQIPDSFFGIGATPVLDGDRLYVAVGGQPNSGVVAFDANTGDVLWENGGKSTWDGAETGWSGDPVYHWEGDEMIVSYASPQLATIHGQRHLLCFLRHGLLSLDPETGKERFHFWFRSRTHESVNAAQPVIVDDTILLGAAYRVGSVCLKVSPSGTEVETIWKDPRLLSTHWSTSLYLDGCYLGFSGRHENEGALQCVDAKTGKLRWQTSGWDSDRELQQGPGESVIDAASGQQIPWPFYGRGSAIMADGKLIVLAERGTLALLTATAEKWEERSRVAAPRMKYPCWAAPVLSRGRLYLRSDDAMTCLQVSKVDAGD